jgi:hypothetical protein
VTRTGTRALVVACAALFASACAHESASEPDPFPREAVAAPAKAFDAELKLVDRPHCHPEAASPLKCKVVEIRNTGSRPLLFISVDSGRIPTLHPHLVDWQRRDSPQSGWEWAEASIDDVAGASEVRIAVGESRRVDVWFPDGWRLEAGEEVWLGLLHFSGAIPCRNHLLPIGRPPPSFHAPCSSDEPQAFTLRVR